MLVLGSGVGDQSGGTGLFYCMERCYKPTVGCAVQGRPPALLPPPSEDTPLLFPGKGMGARETSWVLPLPPLSGGPCVPVTARWCQSRSQHPFPMS